MKCKGKGKAKDFDGCGVELDYTTNNNLKTYKAKYGLGFKCGCYQKWLLTTPEGKEQIKRSAIKGKRIVEKEERKKFIEFKRSVRWDKAMDLADMYFSRYIRLKHSEDGKCTCYTCGAIKGIKEVDNGHFIKREHQAVRYHKNNCRPQCKTCNGDIKHNGKQLEFRENLILEIGLAEVEELERLGRSTFKTNAKYFRDIADEYREKVKRIQKEKGIKVW
jgi:hypothetical protein